MEANLGYPLHGFWGLLLFVGALENRFAQAPQMPVPNYLTLPSLVLNLRHSCVRNSWLWVRCLDPVSNRQTIRRPTYRAIS
ncbi:hypothetical protein CONLIGDRAFT_631238 [Coniochaeta ligniaria NRRL 30616]|uniref:Secreted protein n=1 Tax=Coniochaeta ligniaria NRRL 30616 TaxID=1408157 RepID=A0A1J7JD95_9PEZI|nr:hypothetical protein CONLIGDRAFT_631238 [Coniochaeta ligniaria NRRL 30616]